MCKPLSTNPNLKLRTVPNLWVDVTSVKILDNHCDNWVNHDRIVTRGTITIGESGSVTPVAMSIGLVVGNESKLTSTKDRFRVVDDSSELSIEVVQCALEGSFFGRGAFAGAAKAPSGIF